MVVRDGSKEGGISTIMITGLLVSGSTSTVSWSDYSDIQPSTDPENKAKIPYSIKFEKCCTISESTGDMRREETSSDWCVTSW